MRLEKPQVGSQPVSIGPEPSEISRIDFAQFVEPKVVCLNGAVVREPLKLVEADIHGKAPVVVALSWPCIRRVTLQVDVLSPSIARILACVLGRLSTEDLFVCLSRRINQPFFLRRLRSRSGGLLFVQTEQHRPQPRLA